MNNHTIIEDFIFERFNSVTSDDCHKIITFFEENPEIQQPGHAGGRENHEVKKSTDITISRHHSRDPNYQKLFAPFMDALTNGNNHYIDHFYLSFERLDSFSVQQYFNIQAYEVGEAYFGWHSESSAARVSSRKLAWMFYLNDVPNGGTEFLNQNKIIEAKEGKLVIWPADWTHTHRGQVGASVKKYILTGWMCFDIDKRRQSYSSISERFQSNDSYINN